MKSILKTWTAAATLAVAGLALSGTALAHHSFAAFDMNKTASVAGTVKAFQWTNPHVYIILEVGSGADATIWRMEGGPPVNLVRGGWRDDTLSPGDKITVAYHPRRDGTHGGSFVSATFPDGKQIGAMGAPPAAGK